VRIAWGCQKSVTKHSFLPDSSEDPLEMAGSCVDRLVCGELEVAETSGDGGHPVHGLAGELLVASVLEAVSSCRACGAVGQETDRER
jgi:hypothetical protein